MQVLHSIADIKDLVKNWKASGLSVGFVPTMGYLHEGHMSLIKESVAQNDKTVVSIFVNPTQFGANEDLDSYPRDLDRDAILCENNHVDVIFNPSAEEMYPDDFYTSVTVHTLTDRLCGSKRPGHFDGVCTVVNKLFNIVGPHKAYFGQKDAQQVAVIHRMVSDLNMPVEVISCPIVRESDGLAMSSRNSYLSNEERTVAPILYQALSQAAELYRTGCSETTPISQAIQATLEAQDRITVDYIELVDFRTLQKVEFIEKPTLCAIAVFLGKTRLIDNIILASEESN